MVEGSYRVCFYGEIHDVRINFFEDLDVVEKVLIGDTWFVKMNNGRRGDTVTFSVHDNYWQAAMVDLRNRRIDRVIGEEAGFVS